MMKYLPYLLIALWLLLLTCVANNMAKELSDLKAKDTIQSQKISALEDKVALCTKEKKELIAEIREITRPVTRLIVINGWVFGVRDENP